MNIGYTWFDPVVVVAGTAWALFLLVKKRQSLIGWMPVALSLYFFIPTVTLMTLWQTVPLMLVVWFGVKGMPNLRGVDASAVKALTLITLTSFLYAIAAGDDPVRGMIRFVAYLGLGSVFLFGISAGREPSSVGTLRRGMVIYCAVLALYGAYQILAHKTGLPYRGIVRSESRFDFAISHGLFRPNSLLNEPKRLAYVLFVGVIASIGVNSPFAILRRRSILIRLLYASCAILMALIAVLTQSGSFLLSVAAFPLALCPWRPRTSVAMVLAGALGVLGVSTLLPESGLLDPLFNTVEDRSSEVEVGLDGELVYRQEFYAADYFDRNPGVLIFGVGVGQYPEVLRRAYGPGVGKSAGGILLPQNSSPTFLSFDISGIGAALIYLYLVRTVHRLFRLREDFLAISLLFLICQSATIDTLLFCSLFAGVGVGRIQAASDYSGLSGSPGLARLLGRASNMREVRAAES